MFNNMKNKIREKTGNDLPKFIANYNKTKNHHSRQSSISSISSITSEHSLKEDIESKISRPLSEELYSTEKAKDNDLNESDNIDAKITDIDWKSKFHEKEQEWNEKEKVYVADLLRQTKELQNALLLVEENQKKYANCQNEKDQLESYQKQEIIKIKKLLLEKEEENNTNKSLLKDALSTIDNLKEEVGRLRIFEEQINTCQNGENENESLKEFNEKYNKLSEEFKIFQNRYDQLEETNRELEQNQENVLSNQREKNIEMNIELTQLRDNVEQLRNDFEEERNIKERTIFRNAQISQQLQLAEQELKRLQAQNEELCNRISQLEEPMEKVQKTMHDQRRQYEQSSISSMETDFCERFREMESEMSDKNKTVNDQQRQYEQSSTSSMETDLSERLREMENEMSDKNKSIKILQQKLSDMKKTLQEELKSTYNNVSSSNSTNRNIDDDINFKYMKHVLVKFLTGSHYEAQHLTRVVASLLQLTAEEEKLLTETLEWRMSWFGIRPKIKHRIHPS